MTTTTVSTNRPGVALRERMAELIVAIPNLALERWVEKSVLVDPEAITYFLKKEVGYSCGPNGCSEIVSYRTMVSFTVDGVLFVGEPESKVFYRSGPSGLED